MIYILEDDHNIRELVVYTLNHSDFIAEGFALPSEFWNSLNKASVLPELILLDIMLPEEDGLTILGKLKSNMKTKEIPVIMLTAKSGEYDKVLGLDGGADDYVAKPFGMMELLARVRAVLRRNDNSVKKDKLVCEDLELIPARRYAAVKGVQLPLTHKEFEVLHLLMQNPEIVFSREKLLDLIWGYSFDGENRTVDVHIRTLRQKLGEYDKCIETVRGTGYCFNGNKV